MAEIASQEKAKVQEVEQGGSGWRECPKPPKIIMKIPGEIMGKLDVLSGEIMGNTGCFIDLGILSFPRWYPSGHFNWHWTNDGKAPLLHGSLWECSPSPKAKKAPPVPPPSQVRKIHLTAPPFMGMSFLECSHKNYTFNPIYVNVLFTTI